MARARPLVTLSYAQTLDGRMATRGGSSQWISGHEGLVFSHAQRARHDAVLVGVGTVLADDPRLTVRLVPGASPLRVVVDSALRTPPTAAILTGDAPTLLATTAGAPEARVAAYRAQGAEVAVLPSDARGRVELAARLAALAARGVGRLMVEGGPTLITALLRLRLADRVCVTVAPKLLGAGREAVGDLAIDTVARAIVLRDARFVPCGADIVVEGAIDYGEAHNG